MPRRGSRRDYPADTLETYDHVAYMPEVDTVALPPSDGGWPGGFQAFAGGSLPYTESVEQTRVRPSAAVGTILSVVGLCAAASGLLAPEGFAIAIVGTSLATLGVRPAGRWPVAGRGLAAFGLVCGVAAIVLSIMAMTKVYVWPNSTVNGIGQLHDWLVAHWSWLRHWSS